MPKYRICVPVSGIQVFEVDRANESAAIDAILTGQVEPNQDDPLHCDDFDIDPDCNNWHILSLNEDWECGNCGTTVTVNPDEYLEIGTPYCSDCDREMNRGRPNDPAHLCD